MNIISSLTLFKFYDQLYARFRKMYVWITYVYLIDKIIPLLNKHKHGRFGS